MSIDNIHPMVMKAARASSNAEAAIYGVDPDLKWEIGKNRYIKTAQAALTECGALAALEALEASERVQTNADADAAHMLAHHAITRVYGSAP